MLDVEVLPRESSPEQRLWCAVLFTYFYDAELHVKALAYYKRRRNKKHTEIQRRKIRKLVYLSSLDWTESPICEMAGIDYSWFLKEFGNYIESQKRKYKA